MLDIHAVTGGGSTSLVAITTIAAGGDGATVAGVPIAPNAVLKYWGAGTTAADTLREVQMISQDQWDPINGEYWLWGTGGLLVHEAELTSLAYKVGKRAISVRQNTGAANEFGFTIDAYNAGPVVHCRFDQANRIRIDQAAGGALTAITWGSTSVAPTNAIPNGYYAIMGAKVSSATDGGLVRFRHADFGNFAPGFPWLDQNATAVANAVLPKDSLLNFQGFQFVRMGQEIGMPCCPVFRVTNAGTGLRFELLDIVADTPTVHLNLAYVAPLPSS